ncbi:HTH-type transcriptional regulator YesS [Paenibacillus solanacearum]|uniref:HTH-type transcriptional regulator YesS n=1 Tax=Paenibacillus solanacearum TaxID=2048548 RepID=A0A916K6C9_9BACL|nr:helix-turn-helix domain-containing protein [Paenibacillus solanacearum]CAG7648236.1 HTH-type transcriptional regulator YesS [Paenibacillus solanacearum]
MKAMLRDRGTFFWKSLMLVLVASCLPAMLIGISIYYVGAHTIVRELNSAHKVQMTQTIQRFDDYLSNLENYCALLAFNPGVDSTLNRMDFAQQYHSTRNLFKTLMLMKGSNPLIKDVALYLKESGSIISDYLGVRTLQTAKDRQLASSLLNTDKLTFMTDLQLDALPETSKVVAIKLSDQNGRAPFGAFFIFINQSMLDRLVGSSATGGGSAFLMDDSGRLVTNDSSADPQLQRALKDAVMRGASSEDTFVYGYGGAAYSVSHQELSRLGRKWIYVSATPLSQITAPVTSLSRIILIIGTCGLIVVLLIAWVTSNRMYRPIQRLINRLQPGKEADSGPNNEIARIETHWERQMEERMALQTRIEKSLPSLREMFLLQFFQGKYTGLSEEEMRGKLRQYGWRTERRKFAFLVLQLHGTIPPDRRMTDKDHRLVAYAAANIMEELTETQLEHGQVFPFHDSSIAALLVLPPDLSYEEAHRHAADFAQTVLSTVGGLLRMQVTVAVGRLKESLLETPEILEETRKALRYRQIGEAWQLVDVHELQQQGEETVQFPFVLEKELIHDLRMGLEEQANIHLRQFVSTLRDDGGTELWIQQGMMKLLGSIHEAVLKSEINPSVLFNGEHMYDELLQIRDPEEMIRWFQSKVIRPFIQRVPKSYNLQMKDTVEEMLEQLHELYLSDISLEYFAEKSGVSLSKLSRAFKQVTGENFVDYVTRLRLAKCKDLLVTTNLKIGDIAETLRYNPPYLVRIFKKYEGMTPGQYREKHAEPSQQH